MTTDDTSTQQTGIAPILVPTSPQPPSPPEDTFDLQLSEPTETIPPASTSSSDDFQLDLETPSENTDTSPNTTSSTDDFQLDLETPPEHTDTSPVSVEASSPANNFSLQFDDVVAPDETPTQSLAETPTEPISPLSSEISSELSLETSPEPPQEPFSETPTETPIEQPSFELSPEPPQEPFSETPTETPIEQPSLETSPEPPQEPFSETPTETPIEQPSFELSPESPQEPFSETPTETPIEQPSFELSPEPPQEPFSETPIETPIEQQPSLDPLSSYEPTQDAFDQTVNALQTAKAEGNSFLSSDSLETKSPEPPSDDKVLNLDQMVAKFNGEEIPSEPNPFEPMKKALEEEEKKELLEKGIDTNSIPLVITPESTAFSPEPAQKAEDIPDFTTPTAPQAIEEVPLPASMGEQVLETSSQPETTSQQTTLSLDDIVDTSLTPPPTPASTSLTTKMDMSALLEKLKNPRMLVAVAGGLVLVFVIFTMFPTLSSSSSTPNNPTNIEQQPEQLPNVPEEPSPPSQPEPPSEPVHNAPPPPVVPDAPTQPAVEPPAPIDTPSTTEIEPFIPDEPEPPITPTVALTSAEMIQKLTELSTQNQPYLEMGEKEDDSILTKYAGYIWYQIEFMKNQLESGMPLSIDYTIMTERITTLLLRMQEYLRNGEFQELSPPSTTTTTAEDRQGLQDFIYQQNGIYSS
ncbi:MAG: hypothetical protein LBP53_03430 [Candidatus Peribacteria bacterium]|jgi:hypothetical protein|nr:hypothetical protein [Candidatus Peribacteria bacterium]